MSIKKIPQNQGLTVWFCGDFFSLTYSYKQVRPDVFELSVRWLILAPPFDMWRLSLLSDSPDFHRYRIVFLSGQLPPFTYKHNLIFFRAIFFRYRSIVNAGILILTTSSIKILQTPLIRRICNVILKLDFIILIIFLILIFYFKIKLLDFIPRIFYQIVTIFIKI